jgi:arylsulfatase
VGSANVGQLLDAVDQLKIRDNTIVVFTSDNGPDSTFPSQGTSGPWSGYYFTHMEGSLRTPFIIRAGRLPAFVADLMETVKWKNNNPKKEYGATLTQNAWVGGPMIKIVSEFEQTLKRYPPVASGTPDPYQPPASPR